MKYVVTLNGKKYEVDVEKVVGQESAKALTGNASTSPLARTSAVAARSEGAASGSGTIKAPMPGTILDVKVASGATVKAGDVLFILEAMKMENEIVAEKSGVISSLNVSKGDKVGNGQVLAVIE